MHCIYAAVILRFSMVILQLLHGKISSNNPTIVLTVPGDVQPLSAEEAANAAVRAKIADGSYIIQEHVSDWKTRSEA